MASEATFRTTSGGTPVDLILKLRKAAQPTEGDLLYAGQRQRTRILDRTARGVDADGHPFAPYSENGPYYYYPNGRVGNAKYSDKQTKEAARRLWRKLASGKAQPRHKRGKENAVGQAGKGDAWITRSGRGLGFSSYAAFKRWLGRSGVDLRGPRAPHMLQAILVKVGGLVAGERDEVVGPSDRATPASELRLGIYGDASERGKGQDRGSAKNHLPRRHFFGTSPGDAGQMVSDIYQRIKLRVRGG